MTTEVASVKSKDVKTNQILAALEWLILLAPFLFGLFFPWNAAPVTVVLAVLLQRMMKKNRLSLSLSPCFLFSCSVVLFHLLGTFWGTDRGMALMGAVQFLPLPLFVLLLEQFPIGSRFALTRRMPYAASVMVILSFLLSRIPLLSGWFIVATRQAGFFQYPNTYALYLLLALVVTLFGASQRFGRIPWLVILIAGIVLSGSRIVFVLLLAVLIFYLIREKDRRARRSVLLTGLVLICASIVYGLLKGNLYSVGRFLTISPNASEFVGRLLYFRDAFPVILKHPLGLGYTGYRWLQGSFQTGVYSVRHVHNEFLQLLLDVGWVPAVLFLWALFRAFRSREGGVCRQLFLAVLCAHCLLDFDTQFVSVALLLLLAMDTDLPSRKIIKKQICIPLLTAVCLFSIWLGSASFLSYIGRNAAAAAVYPSYTEALAALLPETEGEAADRLADRILRLNDCVLQAQDVKAHAAFSQGHFTEMQSRKMRAIQLARYTLEEYLDYFDLLIYSYGIYMQNGDTGSAAQCLTLMKEIPEMLDTVKSQTSPLGWKIAEWPNLDLPGGYLAWTRRQIPPA